MANSSSNIPSSTLLTDQANGLVLIDNGSAPQEAQRPILELPILTRNLIDPNADYDDVWDASAARMVRVLATRASQTNYLADGVNDTRTGSLGNINTSIFAAWDHIHPIVAITAPTAPTITVSGGAMTIVQNVLSTVTEEECVTFQMRIDCTIPIHTGTWQIFQIPSIAGFKTPIVSVEGTYRSAGNPTGYPTAPVMGQEASLWGNNLVYVGSTTENVATTRFVMIKIKYVIN